MKLNEDDILKKLCPEGKSPEDIGIMPLEMINARIKDVMPEFAKRGLHRKEYLILSAEESENFEDIVKIARLDMIPPGPRDLNRKRRYAVFGNIRPAVVVPIMIKIGQEIYHLFCVQDRVPLGGITTIEVYRGYSPVGVKEGQLATELVKRKLPNIFEEADLLEIRNLGYYWMNTGASGSMVAVQALFFVAKKAMDPSELKLLVKLDHSLDEDPKTGPTLPAMDPVIKTLEEVEKRLQEVANLDLTNIPNGISSQKTWEAYINDALSMTGLLMLERSIRQTGLPY